MRLSPVSFGRFAGSIALVVSLGLLLTPLTAQNRSTRGPFSMATTSRPQADVDWPLHSFDIRSSRFAPLGQINVSNVGQLAVKWSARIAGNIGEETPVVANGHVYVASYKRLSIFGLLPSGAQSLTLTADPSTPSAVSDSSQHEIFGTISTLSGSQLTVQTRTGSLVSVDASLAIQNDLCIDLGVGGVIDVQGTFDANGVLKATSIQRAKDSPDLWPADI